MSDVVEAPAGFWRRYAAWSLDWCLLGALLLLPVGPLLVRAWTQVMALNKFLQDWVFARVADAQVLPSPTALSAQLLSDPVLARGVQDGSAALTATITSIVLLLFGVSALYFVAFEGSAWHATPGKRLLRLRVLAAEGGGEAGYARALGRHLAGVLSWVLLNIGHAMVAWRKDHRALHDLIAGTQVLAQGPMPAWARAWLLLQGLFFIAATVGSVLWLAVMFSRIMAG